MNHFLTIGDHDKSFLQHILQKSHYLHSNPSIQTLQGKNMLFSFEKPSLRTLVASEVAINKLGGNVIHISPGAFLGGKVMHPADLEYNVPDEREALQDTVKNVSEWCDTIFARVYQHATLTTLASYSGIPIVNGLSEKYHPMQALADLYTLHEKFGDDQLLTISFIGDANNVSFSLIEICLIFGHTLRFSGPPDCAWNDEVTAYFRSLAQEYSGTFQYTTDPVLAVSGADVIYTDAFVSMGEEHIYQEKLSSFEQYQVNENLMKKAPNHAGFMHCLPAHRGVEVTDEVLGNENSWVYDQARNRMVTALGVFTVLITEK